MARAGEARLLEAHRRDWITATFTGLCHWLRLSASPAAARRLAGGWAPEGLALPGHLVVELTVEEEARRPGEVLLWVAVLTVEAC